MKRITIGFIGCGNMASAIAKGVLEHKTVSKKAISVFDVKRHRAMSFRKRFGVNVATSLKSLADKRAILMIAVKPQDKGKVFSGLNKAGVPGKMIISIMAGVKIEKIKSSLRQKHAVIRAMPNIGAFVKHSTTAVTFGKHVTGSQKKIAKTIFDSIGYTVLLKEKYFDLFTAIIGSGPAYFYYLVDIMTKFGVSYGIRKKDAEKMVSNAFLGSAIAMVRHGHSPALMIKKVASKGGVTEAALKVFKKRNVKRAIYGALNAAIKRSKQLSG